MVKNDVETAPVFMHSPDTQYLTIPVSEMRTTLYNSKASSFPRRLTGALILVVGLMCASLVAMQGPTPSTSTVSLAHQPNTTMERSSTTFAQHPELFRGSYVRSILNPVGGLLRGMGRGVRHVAWRLRGGQDGERKRRNSKEESNNNFNAVSTNPSSDPATDFLGNPINSYGSNSDSDSDSDSGSSGPHPHIAGPNPSPSPSSSFHMVGGNAEAISELRDYLDFLKNPEPYIKVGANVPRGILLTGPPGVGKTHMARSLAKEAGIQFFDCQGTEFLAKYVGVGPQRLRSVFEHAWLTAPAIVFIDEIDVITRKRELDTSNGGANAAETILTQLLTLMDGFKPMDGVLVIGTTNRIEVMDPAVLRPGRFDRILFVPPPNLEDRRAILDVHTRDRPMGPDVDLNDLAERTSGLTGADLKGLIDRAAILAARANRSSIEWSYIQEAFKNVRENSEKAADAEQHPIGSRVNVSFGEIAGVDAAKLEVEELLIFITNAERFTAVGATIPKGILLVGPPGTGKTMLAKALATKASVPFFYVAAAELVSKWAGGSSERLRTVFKQATAQTPSILFIDEIDSIGGRRSEGPFSTGADQTLTQLLTLMDGFKLNSGLLIIAATNRLEVLDPALTRPGRFDKVVAVDLPTVEGRLDILKVQTKNLPLDPDVDLKELSRRTSGMSGADLKGLLNDAAVQAAREGKATINRLAIDSALERLWIGLPGNNNKTEDTKLVAYHEAGHALSGAILYEYQRVQKVTIRSRGHAGGVTIFSPTEEGASKVPTFKSLRDAITTALSGRMAEELIFGKDSVSVGASSDFVKATRMAHDMVTKYGFGNGTGPMIVSADEILGEEARDQVDQAINKILDDCLAQSRQLLEDNRAKLDAIALALMDKETISGDEVYAIVEALIPGQRKPFPSHWGKPPTRQTMDVRQWPNGYGWGSGTVAKWIEEKLKLDAAAEGKDDKP